MKVGDLIKVELFKDIFYNGIIVSIRQKRLYNGLFEKPNDYAYSVVLLGDNKATPVFESEIVEIISENR